MSIYEDGIPMQTETQISLRFIEKCQISIEKPNFEKNSKFGLTSFSKVVRNGTITKNRSQTPHDSIENTGSTKDS